MRCNDLCAWPHMARPSPLVQAMTIHEGHSNPLRAVESNSEVLLWQSRYRLGVVALIGASGFLLRMVGALGSGAVGMHTLGAGGTFATLLLLVGAYAAIVGGVMVWARRTHHA